ncbi:MAG: hypothetical protein HYV60_13000 [Planctomycetia bacterium]|nr:hypothetical protein [Planctomycetia bacterium]
MSLANKRRWNKKEVLNAQSEAGTAMTEAERYLLAGRIVRQRIRRGSTPQAIAVALGMTIVEALSALQYVESSPALILRALVEEWPWKKIKHHLQGASPDMGRRSL